MNSICIVQLLNKCINDSDISFLEEGLLEVDDFLDYKEEISFIYNFYKEYNKVPDLATVVGNFNDFTVLSVKEELDYLIAEVKKLSMINHVAITVNKVEKLFSSDRYEEGLNLLKVLTENNFNKIPNAISLKDTDTIFSLYDNFLRKGEHISSGIEGLDNIISGWDRGEELVVFYARTGNGKTWLILKTLTEACKKGFKVGFISPEMSAFSAFCRFATLDKNFSYNETLNQVNQEAIKNYIDSLKNYTGDFLISTPKDFNYKISVSKIRAYIKSYNLDIIGIDGLKYMYDERGSKYNNLATTLTNISEDLMRLSVELSIPIIVAVQANRHGALKKDDEGMPDLSTIKDSDGISHNATKVLALRQIENYLNIEIQKNRYYKSGQLLSYAWEIDTGNLKLRINNSGIKNNNNNFSNKINKAEDVEEEEF